MALKNFLPLFLLPILLLSSISEVGSIAPTVYAPSKGTTDSSPLASDLNNDGVVNMVDISIVALACFSRPGDLRWNPIADLNGDNYIDLLDVAQVAQDFMKRALLKYDFDKPLDWTVVSGTWGTANGLLEGISDAEGFVYNGDIGRDFTLTARVKIAADSPRNEIAFLVCFADLKNYYWIGLGCWDHRVSISRKLNGVAQELSYEGSVEEVAKNVWYNISVVLSADRISLYINDQFELEANDSALNGGAIGVRCWNAHVFLDYVEAVMTRSEILSELPFLGAFHTGAPFQDVFARTNVWTPAMGIVKFSSFQRDARNPTTINDDGSLSGGYANGQLYASCNSLLSQGVVPLIEMTRIRNFENLTETAVRNFLQGWGTWIKTNYPQRFVLWSPACEFNFPDGVAGWGQETGGVPWKIDYRYFNPQISMIRRIRDELGLQNTILIVIHANLLVTTNRFDIFTGIDEYVEGFAQGDVFGVSHYLGYEDSSFNPGGLTWQETLNLSWTRSRIIWQKVCQRAGKELPFYFVEFSPGSVWDVHGTPLWKEAVTYVYTQMVNANKWVKGLLWYVGDRVEPDAMDELLRLGSQFEGYA